MKIRRALLTVSDKTGLVDFARALAARGVELIATGGTAKTLRDANISVRDVSDFTGFPEMLDGRVKTLHPKIHGGLLFLRGNPEHEREIRAHGIEPIDLVVANLYPFEQMDIGGVALLRSAAKNFKSVAVVTEPADYAAVLRDLDEHGGDICDNFRMKLAVKAYETTAKYDAAIADFLHKERRKAKGAAISAMPETLNLSLKKAQDLRYGENPHQNAALYGDFSKHFAQLHGKELSYNNILDMVSAQNLVTEFDEPTVAIIKHTNPCGVGSAETLADAWEKALATDKQSAFGGVIASNRAVDGELAEKIAEIFSEVIVAPDFLAVALEILRKKKNLRLVKMAGSPRENLEWRTVSGGILAQEADTRLVSATDFKRVTRRKPTEAEERAMLFAWRVAKHVKSNAIVFAGENRTLGIGAGQMSRVDSVKLAAWKAREAGLDLRGSACASDGFFPFADGVTAAAESGATAVIQPGGSVRDEEVIAAANERNLTMVFTGIRHFRH
jgi:phosphoribosylaminoimidazolecarboxamide formyltransferase/IMP cyclohydrolase